jgi:diguanylate cyclase (GGDEF)-like protein/PAS domain S-box-containing protein
MTENLSHEFEKADESEAEDRFYKCFHFSPAALCLTRVCDSRLIEVNQAFCEMFGYSRNEAMGRTTFELKLWVNPDERQVMVDSVRRDGFVRDFIASYRTRAGESRLLSMSVHLTKLSGVDCFITSLIDITERKRLESELERRAKIDYLTGVSNHGYFIEQAELEINRAIRYDNPISFLMMDIDFFKQINDTHGHKAGDSVLKKLGEICRQTLREIDVIGRLGGEEFAIMLPETDIYKAAEVAERLRAALANATIALDNIASISFTVSIGVASLYSKSDNTSILFNIADKALYEAKGTGRNKVCVARQ